MPCVFKQSLTFSKKPLLTPVGIPYDEGGRPRAPGAALWFDGRANSNVSETVSPAFRSGDLEAPPVARNLPAHPGPPPLARYHWRQALGQLARLGEDRPPARSPSPEFLLSAVLPSWLASAVVHLLLLIVLGVWMLTTSDWGDRAIRIEVVRVEEDSLLEDERLEELALDFEAPSLEQWDAADEAKWTIDPPDLIEDTVSMDLEEMIGVVDDQKGRADRVSDGMRIAQGFSNRHYPGGGLAVRALRRRAALAYGATPDSENAVELALEWLARHQRPNGSWNLNHRQGPRLCRPCRCRNPGPYQEALNAATALSLLAFLGAGYTHLEGRYREPMARGLRFLMDRQKHDGSLFEPQGQMYSHGLATLALAEALAMTRWRGDRPGPEAAADATVQPAGAMSDVDLAELIGAAQSAVGFIQRAQHQSGGWRYLPGQPGDTSVVGWQMMALRSAQLAGLEVDPETLWKASRFLHAVSDDRIGSCYGYSHGKHARSVAPDAQIGPTTAIGLLCRMYTGWDRDQRGLAVGVQRIARHARPSQGMYFYYYATQVMHHYGGPSWHRWNDWMRDHLVRRQCRRGPEAGSWYFRGSFDDAGRLYCTALATMTLEVYYRYSPIYRREAVSTGRPFDE